MCRDRYGTAIAETYSRMLKEVFRHRSRIVQTFNVPQRVRLGPSLAAALREELFERPA